VNEDRHLTTQLLLRGHKVTLNPHGFVATDTPTTLSSYLRQQVRWSRGIIIETIGYPRIFVRRHPVLLLATVRRFYIPYSIAVRTVTYLQYGRTSNETTLPDIALRVLLCSLYTMFRDGHKVSMFLYLCLSQFFTYSLQFPVLLWALVTLLDGTWGTAMRNAHQRKRDLSAWRQHVALLTFVSLWIGLFGASLLKYLGSILMPGHGMLFSVLGFLSSFCIVCTTLVLNY